MLAARAELRLGLPFPRHLLVVALLQFLGQATTTTSPCAPTAPPPAWVRPRVTGRGSAGGSRPTPLGLGPPPPARRSRGARVDRAHFGGLEKPPLPQPLPREGGRAGP